ncbi:MULTISPECIES: hypothetical protein [Pseudomonadaceae]|uniref:hypothetical protein n=1 Tax=Pseudomonadaceae TaxID=135621 RepID=UPI00084BADB0|nr:MULTISPECIES: hypothetical protein [Pseudomonas]OEC61967.1 hypothetical protein A9G05_00500 [Pseudomonas sp. ENNP23]
MKKILSLSAVALSLVMGVAQANSSDPVRGQITFVGRIVKDMCSVPTNVWQDHVGRANGISPRAPADPFHDQACAGVANTHSVAVTPIATRSGRKAGIITVTFN